MENLKLILKELKKRKGNANYPYFIPEEWNCIGFERFHVSENRPGEIGVNPYDFYASCIEYCMNTGKEGKPVSTSERHRLNLSRSAIYSMFPRTFTAWDHIERGSICPGSFLKSLCLLPALKKMNIDIVYLLPVFQRGSKYKKGDLGSPYSIKNVYKLDKIFHDNLLGEYNDNIISAEFKAFVEACHIMGMHVIVDYAFRTVSRDNDLILEHPDWFYWIDLQKSTHFSAPSIDNGKSGILLSDNIMDELYRSKGAEEYLSLFTLSPDRIDHDKWTKLIKVYNTTGENILDLVEKYFGITTVPGFSNVINDCQPPWTDATFLRYYFDNHKKAEKYVDDGHSPYIMQDGVCLNMYHGDEANKELWDYITEVIPFYQTYYGIDGARIDMGHALPCELNKEIVKRARSINNDFIFWSEEFDPNKSDSSKQDGFNFISGSTWASYKNIEGEDFYKELVVATLLNSALPVTAALETPDTPRSAYVFNDRRKIKFLTLINSFLPNTIPFINNGQELMEVQPMNLGLDNTEEGRFVIDREDPQYGKLAFFDNYELHWKNTDRFWIKEVLMDAAKLRDHFIDILSKKSCFMKEPGLYDNDILILCYYDRNNKDNVFLIGNKDFNLMKKIKLSELLPEEFMGKGHFAKLVYSKDRLWNTELCMDDEYDMTPGEVLVGRI